MGCCSLKNDKSKPLPKVINSDKNFLVLLRGVANQKKICKVPKLEILKSELYYRRIHSSQMNETKEDLTVCLNGTQNVL